jgi:Domain of unknown function (DUF6438)
MTDEDGDRPLPRPWGDYAMILIAAAFSVCVLSLIGYMFLGGHPYAVLFGRGQQTASSGPAPPPQVPMTLAPGEVAISTSTGAPIPGQGGDATAFPEIKDWSSLRIGLQRTACFGTCPAYSVEIAGDGGVTYNGERCVAQKGTHTAHIAPEAVRGLVDQFRKVRFFALPAQYSASVTDLPSFTTSIRFDGVSHSVGDYGGTMIGMPQAVRDLEDAVDKTAATQRWISGGPGGC